MDDQTVNYKAYLDLDEAGQLKVFYINREPHFVASIYVENVLIQKRMIPARHHPQIIKAMLYEIVELLSTEAKAYGCESFMAH